MAEKYAVHYHSNGTEQGLWMEEWCERCERDAGFREGVADGCEHALNIVACEPDPVFVRINDRLHCTAFVTANEMTLVAIDPDHCPVDGTELAYDGMAEPALFKHGGYGATRKTVIRYCRRCGWQITREVSEISPRGDH